MHRARDDRPYTRILRSIAGTAVHIVAAIAVAAQAAMGDVLDELARRFLIHLAAGPYPAGELYDPSDEYETAREILAMERLVTGTFGSLVGAGRVLRLFGGIEPLPGLVHCTIAMRTTEEGDDLFLSFELDPLMLDDHEEPTEFTVQLIRTPKDEGWQGVQRAEFADATAALFEFYSERPPCRCAWTEPSLPSPPTSSNQPPRRSLRAKQKAPSSIREVEVHKVVHIRRDAYDAYIGRGSIWGNPFKIGPDGDRAEVLRKYKDYLLRGEGRHLLQRIGELEGKTLGCFCAEAGGLTTTDETRCHGQLLLQLLERRRRARNREAARTG